MAATDPRAQGAQTAQQQAKAKADLGQYLAGMGYGNGTLEDAMKWAMSDMGQSRQRMAQVAQATQSFTANYQPNVVDEAPAQPQMALNFEGDFSKPGMMENYAQSYQPGESAIGDYWDQNKAAFAPPGAGDQHWNAMNGGVAAAGNAGNRADEAYQAFKASTPANTDPYYDYAIDRSQRELNSAMAGRGMGRSSWAVGQTADLNANLRGQQAQANAGYGLQRAGLMGQLGAAGDASERANSQNQLSWLQGAQAYRYQPLMMGAQVAGQVDQTGMARDQTGAQIASMGQNAARNRGQDYFNNTFAVSQAAGNTAWNAGAQGIGASNDAFNAGHEAAIGANRENVTAGQNKAAQNAQNMGIVGQIYSSLPDTSWQDGAYGNPTDFNPPTPATTVPRRAPTVTQIGAKK